MCISLGEEGEKLVPGTRKRLTEPVPFHKLDIQNGWITCPLCRQNHRLLRIHPDTEARNLEVYCRYCKKAVILDIEGQSLKDRSR